MRPEPTGDYQTQSSMMSDVLVYHYDALPVPTGASIISFHDPILWQNHYKPFSVAIVRRLTGDITLVRDHWGISPLYYYCSHDELIFGATIPDILKHLPNTPPLRSDQINKLFTEPQEDDLGETLYQGIYRVPPGHMLHFKPDGTMTKQAFWQLERHGPTLHYANEHDYLEHFSQLMQEAVLNATENQTNIAAEFSAGLDSSALYCAARNINVTPKLFMHAALPDTEAETQYNDKYEKAFLEHYQISDLAHISADDFDPLHVFTDYASLFAGPAPYLFFMFANPLHRAVAAGKHPILLSGFGGDQCVSCQLAPNFFIPELIHQRAWQDAWRALSDMSKIKKTLRLATHAHPALYALQLKIKKIRRRQTHPYERIYYKSAREAQWSLLQGADSYEIRMRIEYSSLVSKKMGFEYRYPLLYPKLVEFMLSLPTEVNRRDGRGRYLIRQYLSQHIPLFNNYRKQEGLGIVPATFDKFKQNYQQGHYQAEFNDLPYAHLIKHRHAPTELNNRIKGFMLNAVHHVQGESL